MTLPVSDMLVAYRPEADILGRMPQSFGTRATDSSSASAPSHFGYNAGLAANLRCRDPCAKLCALD